MTMSSGAPLGLKYLSVGTQESPEICEYPDSGKFRAEPIDGRMKNFDVIRAMGESVGYWEGEP